QFDKKGKATAPVNELEIISPQAAMGSLRSEVTGKKEANDDPGGLIIGHIKSIKNNSLTVQTPNGTYSVDLGANPSIKVNVSDLRLAQVGDKVDAKGVYSPQGLAMADEIKVTLSTPLGEGRKKPSAKVGNSGTASTNK
ncbi:MAG TPA: hypothetical protein VMJ32_02365, partial [Pirellulales bacterium]|nr:hypothetical protein [Pirellulales bacterium]